MTNRNNFKAVLNPPKDHAMIAAAQAETALPFTVEWRHVPDAGLAESSERFKDAQSNRAVNCPQLRPCFGREGEKQRAGLVEQLLDHLGVIAAHDGVARAGLGKTAADGFGKIRTDWLFRDYRQEPLGRGDLRLRN